MTDTDSPLIKMDGEFKSVHYHGQTIRGLFLTNGILMLVGLTIFYQYIRVISFIAILGILVIAILAGLTSQKHRFAMILDLIVSLIGSLAFEFTAIQSRGLLFYLVFNQTIAIIFFIAAYLSIRSFFYQK